MAVVKVEAMAPTDRPFVLRTWRTESVHGIADKQSRARVMGLLSERLIDRLAVLVARPLVTSESVVVLGWLAHDGKRVHAAYVREQVRGIGIGRALHEASRCSRVVAHPMIKRMPVGWHIEPWHGWAMALEERA